MTLRERGTWTTTVTGSLARHVVAGLVAALVFLFLYHELVSEPRPSGGAVVLRSVVPLGSCGTSTSADSAMDAVAATLRTASTRTGGRVGLAAIDVETGDGFAVRGDEPVFLSSVIKLPIAIAVLRGVDAGEIALEDTVALRVADLRAGHSPLAEGHPEGLRVTVGELLRAAISDSDNTASDALLRLAGGAEAVTHVLRELEVDGVRVDRGYAQFFWDYNGVGDPPEPERWTPALFDSVGDAVPVAARGAAAKRFAEDDRDTGTPCGLASLFARLARGELLGWRSTQLLLGWMTRSANPATRIVAGIPAGTTVAHKTGTWGSDEGLVAVNDVGIVTLPDGRRVALAILVAAAERPLQEVERAMADVTRTVYDTWPGTRADEAENVDGDHSSKEAQA